MAKSVVLVLGEESFLARQAVADVLGRGDHDVSRYAGDSVEPGAVFDELRTPSLFGKPRAVVIERAAPILEGDALDAFAAYAKRPAEGALLVLQTPKLDGRLKAAKALKKAAEVIACDPLKTHAVAGWIGDRARAAHGLQVGRPAAEALRERIGEDLGLLDAALARLRDQITPRKRLEVEDVADSTGDHRSPILFEASNSLEARDLDGALRAVHAAFEEGVRIRQSTVTEPPGIALILLGQLHGAYAKLLRFHMHRQQGDREPDAARAAGVSPAAARFFVERARRHRLDRLIERHRWFVAADLGLKTGGKPAQVLETLLLRLLG